VHGPGVAQVRPQDVCSLGRVEHASGDSMWKCFPVEVLDPVYVESVDHLSMRGALPCQGLLCLAAQ